MEPLFEVTVDRGIIRGLEKKHRGRLHEQTIAKGLSEILSTACPRIDHWRAVNHGYLQSEGLLSFSCEIGVREFRRREKFDKPYLQGMQAIATALVIEENFTNRNPLRIPLTYHSPGQDRNLFVNFHVTRPGRKKMRTHVSLDLLEQAVWSPEELLYLWSDLPAAIHVRDPEREVQFLQHSLGHLIFVADSPIRYLIHFFFQRPTRPFRKSMETSYKLRESVKESANITISFPATVKEDRIAQTLTPKGFRHFLCLVAQCSFSSSHAIEWNVQKHLSFMGLEKLDPREVRFSRQWMDVCTGLKINGKPLLEWTDEKCSLNPEFCPHPKDVSINDGRYVFIHSRIIFCDHNVHRIGLRILFGLAFRFAPKRAGPRNLHNGEVYKLTFADLLSFGTNMHRQENQSVKPIALSKNRGRFLLNAQEELDYLVDAGFIRAWMHTGKQRRINDKMDNWTKVAITIWSGLLRWESQPLNARPNGMRQKLEFLRTELGGKILAANLKISESALSLYIKDKRRIGAELERKIHKELNFLEATSEE